VPPSPAAGKGTGPDRPVEGFGRNRLPFEEMVKLELFYIENWSLLFDLKIILRTVMVMLQGDGY